MDVLRFTDPVLQRAADTAKELRRHAATLARHDADAANLAAGVFSAKGCIPPIVASMSESPELLAAFTARQELRRFTLTSKHFPEAADDLELLGEQLVVTWLTIRGSLTCDTMRKRLKGDAADLTPAVSTLASLLCEPPFVVPPHDDRLHRMLGSSSGARGTTARPAHAASAPLTRIRAKPGPAAAASSAAVSGSGAGRDTEDDFDDASVSDTDSRSAAAFKPATAASGRKASRKGPLSDGFPKSLVRVPFQIKARPLAADDGRTEDVIEPVGWPQSGWKAAPAVHAVTDAAGTATGIAVDPRHAISASMAFAIGSSVQTMAAEEALTTEEAGAMNEAIRDLLELCQRAVHGDKGCRIAVYGSAATGLAARGSDVDTVFVGTLRDTSMTGDDVREFLANKSAALGRKPVKRHRTYAAPLVRPMAVPSLLLCIVAVVPFMLCPRCMCVCSAPLGCAIHFRLRLCVVCHWTGLARSRCGGSPCNFDPRQTSFHSRSWRKSGLRECQS